MTEEQTLDLSPLSQTIETAEEAKRTAAFFREEVTAMVERSFSAIARLRFPEVTEIITRYNEETGVSEVFVVSCHYGTPWEISSDVTNRVIEFYNEWEPAIQRSSDTRYTFPDIITDPMFDL